MTRVGGRSVTGASSREGNGDIEQKCNWGHGETSGHRSITGAWLHSLQQCMMYFRAWECSYKLNDQPVCERVTASTRLKTFLSTEMVESKFLQNLHKWS